jgi:hypothetical protein
MSFFENAICHVCLPIGENLTLAALSSVLEVGVGLFLALTILQVIGSSGVATLRRRTANLRATINTNDLNGQRHSVGQVDAALLKLEIELGTLSKSLLAVALLLLIVSLLGLVASSLYPDKILKCRDFYFIVLGYVGLPILLFWMSTLVFNWKCSDVKRKISDCEDEVILASAKK